MADTPVEVDVNTDNLDDFNSLFTGKAKQAGAPVVEDENVAVDHSADDAVEDEPVEDDADAADEAADDEPSDAEDESGEDEDGSDEGEKDEDEDDDILAKKPKPKQTAKERIAELTAARRSAERATEDANRRNADLERRLRELEERTEPKNEPKPNRNVVTKQDDAAGAPRPDDVYEDGSPVYPLGEYDPQYLSDFTDFRFDQRMKEVDAARAQEAQQNERQVADQKLATKWEGKLGTAEKELPDLRETIAPLQNEFRDLEPNYGMYLAQTIMSMDAGPEVLYYLANNVDEAREIVAAGPQGATLKLGKLEARIQGALAKKAAKPVRTTTAPKPAPVVTRGVGTRGSTRGDTSNLTAFEKEFFKK